MSGTAAGHLADDELVEASIIEAFVPCKTNFDIKEEIESWSGQTKEDDSSLLPLIEQRKFLLLDELVPVGVVLRTVSISDLQSNEILSRLNVRLEARVIGSPAARQSDSNNPAQVSEVLHTLYTKDLGTPVICRRDGDAVDGDDHLYICWTTTLKLSRPKAKLLKLGVYFVVSASIGVVQFSEAQPFNDDYLPSLQGLAPNVLQTFGDGSGHGTVGLQIRPPDLHVPRLSAGVINKPRSIKSGSRQLFRTAPALLWRLKFLTLPNSPFRDETTIALDLEVTTFAESPVRVESIQLTPNIGSAELLGASLPMTCMPGDQATLIYKLTPDRDALPRLSKDAISQEIQIVAQAKALISDVCQPLISITWKTMVETPSARPVSGIRPILHASRPGTADLRESGDLAKTFDPDALTMADRPGNIQSSATVASGVTLSISGPSGITAGQPFEWRVLVDNRSDKSQRLAIVTIPKRQVPESIQPSNMLNIPAIQSGKSERGSTQESTSITTFAGGDYQTGLVCLTPDVRIGPLAASASHEAIIKFLPLDHGIAHLDAFRLVDMSNQNAIDILNIPDIVVGKA